MRVKVVKLFLMSVFCLTSFGLNTHTFYASIASIKAHEQGGIKVKLRIFSDDLANAMSIDSQIPIETTAIKQYISKHLHLSINNQPHPWNWESVLQKGEHTECTWRIPVTISEVETFYIKNTLLVAVIEQQVNIMRLYLKDRKLIFNFNSQIQEELINYH